MKRSRLTRKSPLRAHTPLRGRKMPQDASKPLKVTRKTPRTKRAKKMEQKRLLCEQYELPILPCSRWGTARSPTRTDLLKGMLWTVFSNFIRTRDRDKNCITCNLPLAGDIQAGHYVPVGNSSIALWFLEENCHGEHSTCNGDFQGWHLVPMRKNLVRLYGEERVAELDLLAGKKDTVKWEEMQYVDLIKHYLQWYN